MPYEIIEKHTTEFLEFALVGTESLDNSRQLVTRILRVCAERGCRAVLADMTALLEPAGMPRDFELVQYLRDTGFSTTIDRFAILHDVSRREVARFFEMACQNRGVNMRAFESRAGAVEWLTECKQFNIPRVPAPHILCGGLTPSTTLP